MRPLLLLLLATACGSAPAVPADGGGAVARPAPKPIANARIAVSGCLLAKSEAEAAAHPPPPATRSPGADVRVEASAGRVSIVHALAHACCLTGATDARAERRRIVVRTTLSGTPCRCRCGSEIRVEVPAEAGSWDLAVEVVKAGTVRTVFTGSVEVPRR